jgi:hypothetical protein
VDGGSEANQSLELIGAADRRITLDEAFLRRFFEVVPDADELRAGIEVVAAATFGEGDASSEAADSYGEAGDSHGEAADGTPSEPAPTPARIAAMAQRGGVAASAVRPEREYLRLADLTTRAEQYRDAEEDATAGAATPFECGRVYGARWRLRATELAVRGVRDEHPVIPRLIDAELLAYADARGVNTWGPEEIKHAVRNGFWAALRRDDAAP